MLKLSNSNIIQHHPTIQPIPAHPNFALLMRLWVWPEIQLFRSQKGHLPVVFFRNKTSISVEAMKFGALGGYSGL
jgi:hypothetical protein